MAPRAPKIGAATTATKRGATSRSQPLPVSNKKSRAVVSTKNGGSTIGGGGRVDHDHGRAGTEQQRPTRTVEELEALVAQFEKDTMDPVPPAIKRTPNHSPAGGKTGGGDTTTTETEEEDNDDNEEEDVGQQYQLHQMKKTGDDDWNESSDEDEEDADGGGGGDGENVPSTANNLEADTTPTPPTPHSVGTRTETQQSARSVPGMIAGGASPNSSAGDSLGTSSITTTTTMRARLRDAVEEKISEDLVVALELTMTNYAVREFPTYKGLYGPDETMDGDFMKTFRKQTTLKVSNMDIKALIITNDQHQTTV
jgi:hypothetical protein